MNNGETTIQKVVCPKGHNVSYDGACYNCETCMTSYDEQEVRFVPVERPNNWRQTYRPTVYGKPN